jgi:hypothetical protein
MDVKTLSKITCSPLAEVKRNDRGKAKPSPLVEKVCQYPQSELGVIKTQSLEEDSSISTVLVMPPSLTGATAIQYGVLLWKTSSLMFFEKSAAKAQPIIANTANRVAILRFIMKGNVQKYYSGLYK